MLDINLIREQPDYVKEQLMKLGIEAPIDKILEADQKRRSLLVSVESLRSQRNSLSREIGRMRDKETAKSIIEKVRTINKQIEALDTELRLVETHLNELVLEVSNMPDESVTLGNDESENTVVRTWGKMPAFNFEPLPH